jgi:hypothetical protein
MLIRIVLTLRNIIIIIIKRRHGIEAGGKKLSVIPLKALFILLFIFPYAQHPSRLSFIINLLFSLHSCTTPSIIITIII